MATYREGSIIETEKGIFELKNNQWVPYSVPPIPGKIKEDPNIFQKLGRQAGLTARAGIEGLTGLPALMAEPVRMGLNLIPGVNLPPQQQAVSDLLTKAGLPSPETPIERIAGTGAQALTGTGGLMGAARLMGPMAQPLTAAPGMQGASALSGGVSGQTAAEMGAGPLGQFLASMAGGVAPMAAYRAPIGQPSARRSAERMVGKALERDILPEEAIDLSRLGPAARLVDIGGPNIRGLAEAAVTPPGQAKTVGTKFLTERAKRSTSRLIGDAKKVLGTDKNAFQTTKRIIEERKNLSAPLYSEANKELVKLDDDLASLMNRPAMKEAFRHGATKAQNDPDWPADIIITKKAEAGKTVPLASLDYAKRSLDDRIGTAIRKGNMDDARIYQGLKTQLTDILDKKYPVYAQAREVFSDRSAMLKAMETGKKILRSEPDEMLEFLSDMPKSEKEMFVVGAMKSITDKLKQTKIGGNAADRLATDLIRERIRPAFPDEDAFNSFVQGLERENVFAQSGRILGGSPTQPRQVTAGQLAGEAADIVQAPTSTIMGKVKDFLGQRQIPEKVRTELAEILFLETMVKPGTFSNQTVARLQKYVPRKRINDFAASLTGIAATQEQ